MGRSCQFLGDEVHLHRRGVVVLGQDLIAELLQAARQGPQSNRLPGDGAARRLDGADDLGVLMPNALGEAQALQQVVEASRLQHDIDQVGAAALVGPDQLLGEHPLVDRLVGLQSLQPRLGS
jgi:hypothetical protein